MSDTDALDFWMGRLGTRSESLRRNYLRGLHGFCNWADRIPDALIIEYDAVHGAGRDPRDNLALEASVNQYLAHRARQGRRASTIRLQRTAILSFFRINGRPLQAHAVDIPRGEMIGSRIPEKRELVRVLNHARSRIYRCAILVQKDCGLRASDLVKLRWDQSIDYGGGFWGFGEVLTQKRGVVATPFIGPEATDALEGLNRRDARIIPIKAGTLSKAIWKLFRQAGVDHVSSHGLRKFFKAELTPVVPEKYVLRMMGRKTSPYDEYRRERLLEAYRKGYDRLRVLRGSYDTEGMARRVQDMEGELEKLRSEMAIMQQAYIAVTKLIK